MTLNATMHVSAVTFLHAAVRVALVWLFTAPFLSPAAAARQDDGGRLHPTSENIPADPEADLLLSRSLEMTSEMVDLLAPMDGEPILIVGDDEVEEEFLSRVADAIVADGRLFVLDEKQSTIRVLSLDGDIAYSIGSRGQGPAEFMRPTGMDLSADGKLVVTDAYRRIQHIDRDGGTQIAQITTDFSADDVCLIDDRLFARGYREDAEGTGHILFELNWQEDPSAAFVPGYQSDHPMARSAMSEGALLACDEETKTLVVAYPHRPVVSAWDATGRQRWLFKLSDFVPFPVRETTVDGRPGIRYSIPDKIGHIVLSLNSLSSGFAAIGIGEAGSEAREGGRDVWLFSMDGSSAGYAGQMSEYPLSGDDTYLVTLESTPTPTVRVYER